MTAPAIPSYLRFAEQRGTTRTVVLLTRIYLTVSSLTVIGAVMQLSVVRRLLDDGANVNSSLMDLPLSVQDRTIEYIDGPFATVAEAGLMAAVLSQIALAIAYLVWQNRARINAEMLGVVNIRYSDVAAAFCWFVPIWSLFGPKKVMNDLWVGSDPALPPPSNAQGGRPPSWLLWAWWLPYLFGRGWATVPCSPERRCGPCRSTPGWR